MTTPWLRVQRAAVRHDGGVAGDEDGLQLSQPREVQAVRDAVYHAGRSNGLGPHRAAAVAEAAALHLVGQLRQRGYRLRVEWASTAARESIEAGQRVYDPSPGPLREP